MRYFSANIFKKNKCDTNVITFFVSLFFILIYNDIFFDKLYESGFKFLNILLVKIGLFLLIFIFLLVFSFKNIIKLFFSLLFIFSSIAYYFMKKYGIFIDMSMIKNLFETDFQEAFEFINISLLTYVILFGLIPSFILYQLPLKDYNFVSSFIRKIKIILLSFIIFIIVFLNVSSQILPIFRERKELRYYIVPINYIYSSIKFINKKFKKKQELIKLTDNVTIKIKREPILLVLIVGESVRASNWKLSGYQRNTTPKLLKEKNLFNFLNVTSCGTDTETSLPCMFSFYGRKNYDESKIKNTSSILHLLKKAGVEVYWIDNQSGDKGVASGLKHIEVRKIKKFCVYERCFDEVLVETVKDIIPNIKTDTIIVMHMLGNHGPAYFKRYPLEFEYFKPSCKNDDLSKCSKVEIINSYDNVVRYTDYIISQMISLLSKKVKVNTALIYVSDHGESLGENNIYLHGIPYYIAPDVQKKIPLTIWISDMMSRRYDLNCLNDLLKIKLSHDNIFHVLLGIFDVETPIYDKNMDFLSKCKYK
ncbi:MAG: phosphoethanolamine--lipid A transferase [Elusimicrobiales bacterium]|nr:phosphoethanolamine--lipid A transferase [Elusimicrobiales bacterium]